LLQVEEAFCQLIRSLRSLRADGAERFELKIKSAFYLLKNAVDRRAFLVKRTKLGARKEPAGAGVFYPVKVDPEYGLDFAHTFSPGFRHGFSLNFSAAFCRFRGRPFYHAKKASEKRTILLQVFDATKSDP
jgi:hypothetical protein